MKFCCGLGFLLISIMACHHACAQDNSATIRATATVVQPVGLLEAQQEGDMLAFPIVAEYSSRWFLYLPRQSNVLVLLDGEAMELQAGPPDGAVTFLDLTEAAATRAGHSVTVTLIYSEN